jgi:hypothetical protein
MPNCTACGAEVAPEANFCEHCGEKINEEESTTQGEKDPSTGPLFEVPIRQYFRTGWDTFLQYPMGFAGFSLIIILLFTMFLILQKKVPIIGFLFEAAISPLQVGIYIVSAKLLQRQTCLFSDFFSGFHYFKPLIIFGLIYGILGVIGDSLRSHAIPSLLVHLASLAYGVVFLFTPMLIADRRLSLWEAMELSLKTVRRRPFKILGFVFLGGLLVVAGAIALGIGVLVTLPLFSAAITAAYADIFGLQSKEY